MKKLIFSLTLLLGSLAIFPKPAQAEFLNFNSEKQRATPPVFRASHQNISVTLTPKGQPCSFPNEWENWTLTIQRENRTFNYSYQSGYCHALTTSLPAFTIVNLDGDREPEIIVNLAVTGGVPGYISEIYDYNSGRNSYNVTEKFWGLATDYDIEDLDNDSIPEFVTVDDNNFRMAVSSSADSGQPVLILRYQNGQFFDVSTQYPTLLAEDAQKWKNTILQAIAEGTPAEGYMLAYYANMVRLDLANAHNSNISRTYRDEALGFLRGKPGWSTVSNQVFRHIQSLYGIY
jgi:hypothetical protein